MEDQLDKLLKNNQSELWDEFDLPADHEKRFAAKLKMNAQKDSKFHFHWYHYAATIIPLLMMVGTIFYYQNKEAKPTTDLAMYSKTLDEKNDLFTVILEAKLEEVETYKTPENKTMIGQSFQQLDQLESEYNLLLEDLKKSGGNPKVIQSVIENLKLRIGVLEQLIKNLKLKTKYIEQENENIL